MIMELSAAELEGRAKVFTSLKTKDMSGAKAILQAKYGDVREEDSYTSNLKQWVHFFEKGVR